jgi:phosphomannomutase / phosphoglucomutase
MTAKFKSMFREYDIRGLVNKDEINNKSVDLIISGFASLLQKKYKISKVVVGYDNRSYSPQFCEVVVKSLVRSGMKVYDVGLSLSPVVYFAQYKLKCKGAVMITASHNPDGWCGFKLAHGLSKTLGPEEITELYSIIEKKDFIIKKGGTVTKINVRDAYIDQIVKRIKLNKANLPRVVIEAGNGGAGVFAYELFQKLGCITFQLYCDPDTGYPNYFPNPSDLRARKRLKEMVTHEYIKADIGIGFDGDGDRIGVIDQNGENIWSDKVLMILAKQLLEKKKGAKIVFDVKCTEALPEMIKKNGGKPIMWKTGHSYIKSKMHEEKADLAGERSGHIFVGGDDYWGFDDALFTAAKLVEYLSHSNKPITDILSDFPQYITSPEIKTHCADDIKYKIVDNLIADFKLEFGSNVNDINGARVTLKGGWGLVRASSNLPELVIIFEAKTHKRLMEIRQIFRDKMGKYKEVDSHWDNDLV